MSIYTYLHAYSVHILKYSYLIFKHQIYIYDANIIYAGTCFRVSMFTYIHCSFLHTDKDVLAKDHVDRHTEF